MKILIEIDTDTQRVVPREPTRDMVIAGTHQRFRDSYDAEEDCYRAMIAAAPQPEPVDVDLRKDAARYRWLRDVSVPPHNFYISVPVEFDGIKYSPEEVDSYIDAAMKESEK